ncbi:MAG: prenyltransferase/squalene oxidase repeat-containing protein [Acidobacteriota bacterium]
MDSGSTLTLPNPTRREVSSLVDRVGRARQAVRDTLLARRNDHGHWRGRLSSSALSTAVAAFCLAEADRLAGTSTRRPRVDAGLDWLALHGNTDGGFGDTVRSRSNLPTTLLSWAALRAAGRTRDHQAAADRAAAWIVDRLGDTDSRTIERAVIDLYGEDRTFSIPILTFCTLAGVLDDDTWRRMPRLPFELALLPRSLFHVIGLPVVSYALPALIAVGQVQHHHLRRHHGGGLLGRLRALARRPTLRRLTALQPASGGFLEAIPLTGFVTLSLLRSGSAEHAVAESGLAFLDASARDDGAWPIDIDLATWVTTLSIQGLDELAPADAVPLRRWLLDQQWTTVHPFTGAAPGGWAWTDLPGGVPDADDTPGALLALRRLGPVDDTSRNAAAAGLRWLVGLQNRDGGMPTFCRGWAKLPFDRSTPDLTAHTLRAVSAWRDEVPSRLGTRLDRLTADALTYLRREQRADGSWVPLWFGNEAAAGNANPVYGTARVLPALVAHDALDLLTAGRDYLLAVQHESGGWGGEDGVAASLEETALAVDALARCPPAGRLVDDVVEDAVRRGCAWLLQAWCEELWRQATPIGFYFANLWYFEDLYPLTFLASALDAAHERLDRSAR